MTSRSAERRRGKPELPAERCERCRLLPVRDIWHECSHVDCPNRGHPTVQPPEGLPFEGGAVPRRPPHD